MTWITIPFVFAGDGGQRVPASQIDSDFSTRPPQTLAVPPPPHVWTAEHVPQASIPPQPSGMVPQSRFCAAHVVG